MKTLLMGGQACVFYGAAEFSRDLDLLILVNAANLERLQAALAELEAERIDVPQLSAEFLRRGHAVHFRCGRPDVAGLRIDVMSNLSGGDSFERLWERRTTILAGQEPVDLLGLEDLVIAKTTQRDKDWPMIRRLVEQSYYTGESGAGLPGFWLRRLRTPEILIDAAANHPEAARQAARSRPAVQAAIEGDAARVAELLEEEERQQRALDREYWAPLRRELEQLRAEQRRKPPS